MSGFILPDGRLPVNQMTHAYARGCTDAGVQALAAELVDTPTPALAAQVLALGAAVGSPLWPLVAPCYHAVATVLAQRAAESEAA